MIVLLAHDVGWASLLAYWLVLQVLTQDASWPVAGLGPQLGRLRAAPRGLVLEWPPPGFHMAAGSPRTRQPMSRLRTAFHTSTGMSFANVHWLKQVTQASPDP